MTVTVSQGKKKLHERNNKKNLVNLVPISCEAGMRNKNVAT